MLLNTAYSIWLPSGRTDMRPTVSQTTVYLPQATFKLGQDQNDFEEMSKIIAKIAFEVKNDRTSIRTDANSGKKFNKMFKINKKGTIYYVYRFFVWN